jgi:hypothetical protein
MAPLDLLALVGMASVPVCVGLTVAWLGARREAQLRAELMRDMRREAPERPSDLRRLQDTVEQLAVEIERLGEGQRFTARILSERSAIDRHLGSGSPPRSITPH